MQSMQACFSSDMQSRTEERLPGPGLETSSDDEDYQPNGDGANVDMDEADEGGPGADADGQPEAGDAEIGMAQRFASFIGLLKSRCTTPAAPLCTVATERMHNPAACRHDSLCHGTHEQSKSQQPSMTSLDAQGPKQLDSHRAAHPQEGASRRRPAPRLKQHQRSKAWRMDLRR